MTESTATSSHPRPSGFALAGLLLGLAATGPLALYFSYRGLYAVNASDGRLSGRGPAIVGLILGGLWSLIWLIGIFGLIIAYTHTTDERAECANNLRVVGLAVYRYADDHEKAYPRAVVALEGVPPENRVSWLAALLPYLDVKPSRKTSWQALAGRLDLKKPWDDPANQEALTTFIPYYQCPGDPAYDPRSHSGLTHYVGVAGIGDDAASLPKSDPRAGFFGYKRNLSLSDVRAQGGTSYKMMVLETTRHNGDWIAGGPPTVRGVPFDPTWLNWQGTTLVGMLAEPNDCFGGPLGVVLLVPRPEEPSLIGPGRPFGGLHTGGLNVLWADGSVRFVTDMIQPRTFRMQATLCDKPEELAVLP